LALVLLNTPTELIGMFIMLTSNGIWSCRLKLRYLGLLGFRASSVVQHSIEDKMLKRIENNIRKQI